MVYFLSSIGSRPSPPTFRTRANICCTYYGWYSNVNRGKRNKDLPQARSRFPHPPGSSLFKRRWAELIKKVYAADPLLCVRCGGAMRIIAFIDQPEGIEKILTHLGLWPHPVHAPPRGAVA